MNYLKTIGAGVLVLGVSLPVWADMTKDEVITKIEAGLSQAQRAQGRDQRVTAIEALLKAGVAPEKCVEIVKSALAHNVPVAEIAKLAREVETRARGDKTKAEKYARERFASAEKRHEASQRLRSEIVSPTRGERGPGGMGSGGGSGFGGQDFTGGAGGGSGQGSGGR